MVFPTETGYVIALTYGRGSDWVRNLRAAGTGGIEVHRQRHEITAVRLVHGDPKAQPVHEKVIGYLERSNVRDFLYIDT